MLNSDFGESTFRKKYQCFSKMFNANQSKFTPNEQLAEIEDKIRELKRQEVKFRDERNAWNKQNYNSARCEQKLDYLEDKLGDIGNANFKVDFSPTINSDNDMLIILSDLHIGQFFHNTFGNYDSDIAKYRLNQYLNEIIKIQKRHNCENAYVSLQGDLISNSIHKSLAITNREDVIDQIKLATEYISSFCCELCSVFNNVKLFGCAGNHSRIDTKNDSLHSERLDNLITWNIKNCLQHIPNFMCLDCNLDIGITNIEIRGKQYIGVHGDYDNFSKSGVANMALMLGFIPYAILMGHRHFPAMTDEGGVKLIQSGSLAGNGDDFAIEKRLSGKPSQTVCICSENGIDCVYPIQFN